MTPDMADAHATARARDALGKHPGHSLLAKPRAKAGHPMTWFVFDEAQHFCTRTHAIHPETGEFTPLTQEPDMTKHDRHDELKALLSKISEESVTTSNVLADLLDLLRERLPESPNHTSGGPYTCMGCGTELYAGDPLDCGKHGEPAPADDLPGEPVEPGDLRAGDRVEFTWDGGRHTCTLVSVHDGIVLRSDTPDSDGFTTNVVWGRKWASGISDVRLIERAPREGEGRDEALARVIFGDAYGSHEGLRLAQLDVALMAREHVEAEWEPYILREQTAREKAQDRAEKAEAVLADMTRQRDFALEQRDFARSTRAEVKANLARVTEERDEWQARHAALRVDVEAYLFDVLHWPEKSARIDREHHADYWRNVLAHANERGAR